jgi:uncharacterized protein YkwD
VSRPKAFLVVVVLLLAIVLGATASPARSTGMNAWCARYATKLPSHSLVMPLICQQSANADAQRETPLGSLNRQIAAAINSFRQSHGLAPLHVSLKLNRSSRQHSEEMGADGYFDHPSADGTPFWKRIRSYYPSKNYSYWTVGENLLFAEPTIEADAALKLWVQSPEHLANLLNKTWRDLGVSSVHVVDAGGVYGGEDVTIITTDFGARH